MHTQEKKIKSPVVMMDVKHRNEIDVTRNSINEELGVARKILFSKFMRTTV